MNEHKHPNSALLDAYTKRPDAEEFRQVSLHLLHCKSCRDQVELSSRLRRQFSTLDSNSLTDEQQAIVDDFLYWEKSAQDQQRLKQVIRNDPQLLKSALFTLSHQYTKDDAYQPTERVQPQNEELNWLTRLSGWLHWQTSTWVSAGVTALVTMTVTVLLLQPYDSGSNKENEVSIASFQDNPVMRFFPAQQLPGIGFFTGAAQNTSPYQGMHVSANAQQLLELNWPPVENASSYRLNLYRFADGEKTLVQSVETKDTQMRYSLQAEDFDHRFEWVLSGNTTDDEHFVSLGGFVITKPLNQGDL